ncbi:MULTISPECIES: tRNA1(Val) (adenine(37)-N6)-methyltransferase [unclassified Ruminococcus]|uniref:tRNA1(Val) (adenine(37)-N6)-methyltransferase n=1 Tax=unclassified Ruminococcus TaxID=2608920 RepID=UPI00210A382D|nr:MULTISPECIES: methyltransferase [unclassified Ruminococcus]MCQ4022943.1 methyltransferase [Ruminococcus sp. zg-924]MCQ4115359.1 methyltransferase [Ruminococcus sp. zg-921]
MLNDDEHFEPLGNGIEVIVSKIHRFGTDTVLLANFSKPKEWENVCEFGSGCGAIALIWCREKPPKHITAVELQSDGADMIRRSTAHNGLERRIDVLNDDLRSLTSLSPGSFDLIACNPPYKQQGGGIINTNEGKLLARHEYTCTIEDVCRSAARLLRFGGRLCLCQRPERLSDVICAMRESGIEPKRLRLIQQRKTKAPKLFLIEGKKGGKSGGLVVNDTLLIEDENGGLSSEMIEIYGDYKTGHI